MDAVALSLAALAVWRLCNLVAFEAGPLDIFIRLRVKLGAIYNMQTDEWESDSFISDLVTCPLCLSVWFALVPAAYIARSIPEFLLCWLGISGASCIISKVLDK